jgi:hypothetical protein
LKWSKKNGVVEYSLECTLALGKIEMESGSSMGRTYLNAVPTEAQSRGFANIAQEASETLQVLTAVRQITRRDN